MSTVKSGDSVEADEEEEKRVKIQRISLNPRTQPSSDLHDPAACKYHSQQRKDPGGAAGAAELQLELSWGFMFEFVSLWKVIIILLTVTSGSIFRLHTTDGESELHPRSTATEPVRDPID